MFFPCTYIRIYFIISNLKKRKKGDWNNKYVFCVIIILSRKKIKGNKRCYEALVYTLISSFIYFFYYRYKLYNIHIWKFHADFTNNKLMFIHWREVRTWNCIVYILFGVFVLYLKSIFLIENKKKNKFSGFRLIHEYNMYSMRIHQTRSINFFFFLIMMNSFKLCGICNFYLYILRAFIILRKYNLDR